MAEFLRINGHAAHSDAFAKEVKNIYIILKIIYFLKQFEFFFSLEGGWLNAVIVDRGSLVAVDWIEWRVVVEVIRPHQPA